MYAQNHIVSSLSSSGFLTAQSSLSPKQEQALELLNQMDTSKVSAFWPMVEPVAFYQNVKKNILFPEKIYQGHATNFCGYAAMSVVLCSQQPEAYTRYVVELYEKGETQVGGRVDRAHRSSSKDSRQYAAKRQAYINPADQLWLISLPDHFKGYMDVDKKFQTGDENLIWAACTLGNSTIWPGTLVDIKLLHTALTL